MDGLKEKMTMLTGFANQEVHQVVTQVKAHFFLSVVTPIEFNLKFYLLSSLFEFSCMPLKVENHVAYRKKQQDHLHMSKVVNVVNENSIRLTAIEPAKSNSKI